MDDDVFLTQAGDLLQLVNSLDPWEYWQGALPSPADVEIGRLSDVYAAGSPLQREILVSGLSRAGAATMGCYATRMAMFGVRNQSEAELIRGLIALVIQMDYPWTDPRDSAISVLVLVFRSAVKLGMDTNYLFLLAAQTSIRQFTKEILYPPRASAQDAKPLEGTGWEETNGPGGLVYYRTGYPIPEGHLTPVTEGQEGK